MKKGKRLFCLFLSLLFLFPIGAKAEEEKCLVCEEFREAGFPPSFCESLCTLKRLHPTWTFTPLPVTALSRESGWDYTWEKVLEEEAAPEKNRSLVPPQTSLAAFRLAGAEAKSDSGYYPASEEAVAFFLDARNFLNESDIFQFLDLRSAAFSSEAALQTLFGNSFLGKMTLQNGQTLSAFLCEVGKEKGIHPLFLAGRLLQEQGANGNPLSTGAAGETLLDWYENGTQNSAGKWIASPQSGFSCEEAEALDGVYNLFNIDASGTGYFAVIRNGAESARQNGWDSPEKSIRGAADVLLKEYILCHQNTLYLQKWNVDARSADENGKTRNFWGQFMQNIGAPLTEARKIYAALSQNLSLEGEFSFLIPFFEGMGDSPRLDPSHGESEVWSAVPTGDAHIAVLAEKEEESVPAFIEKTPEKTEAKSEVGTKEEEVKSILLVLSGALLLFSLGLGATKLAEFFYSFDETEERQKARLHIFRKRKEKQKE